MTARRDLGRVPISAVDPDIFGPIGCHDCGMPATWLLLDRLGTGIVAVPACDSHGAVVDRPTLGTREDLRRVGAVLLVSVTAIAGATAVVYLAWQVARAMFGPGAGPP